MRVSELAVSYSDRVAAGAFEKTVSVWDIETLEPISEFETIFSTGGNRLAISPSGNQVVAGTYYIHGIAAYRAQDGMIQWQRKDLRKVQDIQISSDGHQVYCGFDNKPCHVLDLVTGSTVETWRGVREVHESPLEQVRILEMNTIELWRDGTPLRSIARSTFAVLSVAFGPGSFCMSESGGPVRCFDTRSARQIWRYDPIADGRHVLCLGYSEESGHYYGTEWQYMMGGFQQLIRFDAVSGASEPICNLSETKNAPADAVFCRRGTCVLTSEGRLLSTATGEVVATIPFAG